MSSLSVHSSQPSRLDIFTAFDKDHTNKGGIATRLSDGTIVNLKNLWFLHRVYQYWSGSQRRIVNDFQAALAAKYGDHIANYAFSNFDQQKAALSGLSHEMIHHVLTAADLEKQFEETNPQLNEATQKTRKIAKQLARQAEKNPSLQPLAKEAATAFQRSTQAFDQFHKSIGQIRGYLLNSNSFGPNFPLQLKINAHRNIATQAITTIKQAHQNATKALEEAQQISPSLDNPVTQSAPKSALRKNASSPKPVTFDLS